MTCFKRRTPIFYILLLFFLASCGGEKNSEKKVDSPIVKQEEKIVVKSENKTILFYGNSLTAGYGLDADQSFPSLVSNIIDSVGLEYDVINAGLSGETTSGGLKRLDWVLKQNVDVFVLELGANDMLRGLPLSETRKNLDAILSGVKAKYPNAKLALCEMMAAPNMGKDYAVEFQAIYKELAKKHDALFVPFFLDGVAGDNSLLLPDGKHPNAEGQKIVAQNIWKSVSKLL